MNATLEVPELIDIGNHAPSSAAEMPSAHVEIYDQVYHLRGVDPVYIDHLAALVDAKMRAVSAQGGTVDSLRVAVLAAMNIADELCSLRQSYNELAGEQESAQISQLSMRSRADSLAGMLDEVLADRRVG
jgi:cell division protein ZapA